MGLYHTHLTFVCLFSAKNIAQQNAAGRPGGGG